MPIVTHATPILRREYSRPIPSRFEIEALEPYSHLDDVTAGHADTSRAQLTSFVSAIQGSFVGRSVGTENPGNLRMWEGLVRTNKDRAAISWVHSFSR
ncbi:MAG: hypothetical protein EOP32_37220 [Rhodococcus sp. (in: high G+C Gram-positive bacteria)]|nr:MAG: hypothetical protein EOP32_37220 [Rhodococcus sp. (in: high G+C Gram-positive bacteria)]